MAYQTLYRKYRSQSFEDLVGQEATSRALRGAIAGGRVAHAYLFSGSRGTGKTTTARLLAKAANCEHREPGSGEPCNRCEWCREVAAGTALDLIEIDAASNRGIDEIRDLRERVNLAPASAKFKFYIIDEAHMLTSEAFNALLKTLEEPPEHVVFVLCTTEAAKVPATITGRCQHFVFRRFNDEQIIQRLSRIADLEGIRIEPVALALVARTAQGSMRDAIGVLDQLVPLAEAGSITLESARGLLGISDPARVDALMDLVLAADGAGVLRELGTIYEEGAELRQLVRALMERSRDGLLRAISAHDPAGTERLSSLLGTLLTLDGEMRRHAEPRFLLEATLLRLAVESAPAASPLRVPVADAGEVLAAPIATVAPQDEARLTAPAPPAAPPEPMAFYGGEQLAAGWRSVLDQLGLKERAYFVEGRPELEAGRLVLNFRYAFHHKMAIENQQRLEPLVRSWLGEEVELEVRLQEQAGAAAAAVPPPAEQDPLVVDAVRRFEARITGVREKR